MKKYLIIRYTNRNNWREISVVDEWPEYVEAKVQCEYLNKINVWEGVHYSVYEQVEV